MTLRVQRSLILIALILFAYCGAYLVFRTLHLKKDESDLQFSIVYRSNERLLYFLFWPLAELDKAATGVPYSISESRD